MNDGPIWMYSEVLRAQAYNGPDADLEYLMNTNSRTMAFATNHGVALDKKIREECIPMKRGFPVEDGAFIMEGCEDHKADVFFYASFWSVHPRHGNG